MDDIVQLLTNATTSGAGSWYVILLAFLAGVLVSFTPCVYPMIPITAGILQSQAHRSFFHSFLSSLAYIIGIAFVYASLGYLSAKTSLMFGVWLANPWFVGVVIIFFLYLAGSMFSLYELYLPSWLTYHGQASARGSIFQSFIFGLVSGTIASPCLSPALALLLGVAAKQANPLIGFLMLFSFSLGMGILLLLVGTFSATAKMLPRAGLWMDEIKAMFGFFMIGICFTFIHSFIPEWIPLLGYALIATAACVYYARRIRVSRLAIALCLFAFLAAAAWSGLLLKMFFE